ncbi:unnamed protein product [Strongylus vulgaris]|uniref:Uncharacterized protein n=1 Tax=Strongylus vulgaris TaxID=40348 RepID=A0A3P7JTX2_STRVU|nr:unnamed protein product [Strongylus vulgaris]
MPMPGVGLTPFSSLPHQAPVETKKDPGPGMGGGEHVDELLPAVGALPAG